MKLAKECSLVLVFLLSLFVYEASAQYVSWDAEDFDEMSGTNIKAFSVPYKTKTAAGVEYQITEAYSNGFAGVAADLAGSTGSWLKYKFTIPKTGDWYIWGRFIAPSTSNNSCFWGIDITDAEIKVDGKRNIWDFFEATDLQARQTTKWVWFRINSRSGPFTGTEAKQYSASPVPVTLSAGSHILLISDREAGCFWDAFYATMDKAFDANNTPPTAAEPQGKATTTWGSIKDSL